MRVDGEEVTIDILDTACRVSPLHISKQVRKMQDRINKISLLRTKSLHMKFLKFYKYVWLLKSCKAAIFE